jgi:hypothetical protein
MNEFYSNQNKAMLVDGDLLAYKICSSQESPTDWGDDVWTLHCDYRIVKQLWVQSIQFYLEHTKSKDALICFSDTNNFRKELDSSYKSYRKNIRKPVCYNELKKWVAANFKTQSFPNLEGDDVIGLLATNRHRDLDIICHFQSLSALDPRMWQNTTFVRFHYQIDDVKRYAQRLPNFEMFKIAQCLVEYKYLKKGDKRFYCYIACDENYITGNYTKLDFEIACESFLEKNSKYVNDYQKKFGTGIESRNKAIKILIKDLHEKYYKGI